MYRKHVLIECLAAVAVVWFSGNVDAQGQTTSRQEPKPTLIERLDEFGQNFMGGLIPRKNKSTGTAPSWDGSLSVEDASPRSGSAVQDNAAGSRSGSPSHSTTSRGTNPLQSLFTNQRVQAEASQPVPPEYYGTPYRSTPVRQDSPRVPSGSPPLWSESTASSSDRSVGGGSAVGATPEAMEPSVSSSVAPSEAATGSPSNAVRVQGISPRASAARVGSTATAEPTLASVGGNSSTAAATSVASNGAEEPLHERLRSFRQSVFGQEGVDSGISAASPRRAPAETASTEAAPAAGGGSSVAAASSSPRPTLAPRRDDARNVPTLAPPRRQSSPISGEASRPVEQSTRAPERTSESHVASPDRGEWEQDKAEPEPAASQANTPRGSASQVVDSPPGSRGELPAVAERAGDPILLTRRGPILNVRTLGPSRIAVGRRSDYEVHMENLGDVAAEDVVVNIALPEWAEVVAAEATGGAIAPSEGTGGARQLLWKVGPLEAKSNRTVVLGIVPRQSRPIDLAVRWDFTPIVSQAVIVVEEPKLAMRLGGPREVRFGEPRIFRLEITNSGNGAAEDAVLTVMPLVPGQGGPSEHALGTIAAGSRKEIELELTAGQPGTLDVRMELRSDGPAKASLSETLLVRKAHVEIRIDAPGMQFTGTTATYRVRVRNAGNTSAENLRVLAQIPPEVKLVEADREGKGTADGQAVEWTLARLAEGEEQVFMMKCRLEREGYSRVKAEASGGTVSAEATAVTRVESIADLALSVKDPAGPVPVGQTVHYTMHIRNRGTKAASGVEAVAYFSEGIEPVSAEGGRHVIRSGQVVFDSIGVVPAGGEVVLKITAKAQTPGNHMFRAEILCRPLGTRLVGEESTHFYRSDLEPDSSRTMIGGAPPQNEAAETADRRNSPDGSPAPAGAIPVQVPPAGRY